ncbi:MAG: putative DNA binding domain-containing protein [Thermoanaerobaculia bacterium]|nr:putative DNA binding domain-containing protein [Thermoanaerobaculia bacterium]
MNAQELLEELNSLDEHERVEAKRSEDAAGHSLLETVCAFANEPRLGGGHILAGVTRDDSSLFPFYVPTGLRDLDKAQRDIASQVRTVFNKPVNVELQPETLEGKRVLVVFVPEAPQQEKPIFFKSQGLPRGAFRRIGSVDQRCTDDDIATLYQGRQTETYDAQVVEDATMDDFSADAIKDYRLELSEANPGAEALRWGDAELLRALKAVRLVRGVLTPTVAGLLLFGSPQALRRCFPMMRVDYVRVPGTAWVPDPDRRFETIEMRDPLLRLIRRSVAAILDDLPKAFWLKDGDLQRTEIPQVPRKVIREAVVNALMHRSYRVHGPVLMIRYANRLEIQNPGFSLKGVEHLGEPGSETRNSVIAAVLHETRLAETKGTGIRVMRDTMEAAGLMPPVFESDRSADAFTARYFFHHFLGPEDVAWLGRFKDLHLSNEDARALIFVREQGAINNATYRDMNRVDTLGASKALRKLRDAGLLEPKNRGAATYYVPSKVFLGSASESRAPLEVDLSAMPGQKPAMESALPDMPQARPTEEPGLPAMEGTLPAMGEARTWESRNLPAEVQAEVARLGQRSMTDKLQKAILTVCSVRPHSAQELAALLGRNPRYLVGMYLRRLLMEGRLAFTIPENPKHPDQAYRTVGIPEESDSRDGRGRKDR